MWDKHISSIYALGQILSQMLGFIQMRFNYLRKTNFKLLYSLRKNISQKKKKKKKSIKSRYRNKVAIRSQSYYIKFFKYRYN